VSANEYPDRGLNVRVGDQLRVFGNFEIHTATFPRGAFNTVPFLMPQCEGPPGPTPDTPAPQGPGSCSSPDQFELSFNPRAIFPTKSDSLADPKRFVNSGLLPLIVPSYLFRAVKPGLYSMVCLVHGPEMSWTVRVRP
jgi:hypothetical protein